jgi:hypothetical protein
MGIFLTSFFPDVESITDAKECDRCNAKFMKGEVHSLETCIERMRILISQVYDENGYKVNHTYLLENLAELEEVREKLNPSETP